MSRFGEGVLCETRRLGSASRWDSPLCSTDRPRGCPGASTVPSLPVTKRSEIVENQMAICQAACDRVGHHRSSAPDPGTHQKARWRNAAIWPRVTRSPGQNRVLAGGMQPLVTPAVPRRSMSRSNTEPSSSVNKLLRRCYTPSPAPETRRAGHGEPARLGRTWCSPEDYTLP